MTPADIGRNHKMRRIRNTRYVKLSKYISFILRHHPEAAGVALDDHGWADVDDLIAGVSKTHPITREVLEEIVRTDSKQRYAFSRDGKYIRANHGHSVKVDPEPEETAPPEFLYHGTAEKNIESIFDKGILPMKRIYVHLSDNIETAIEVGRRHGKPVVIRIRSGEMYRDGHPFFRSTNDLWLTSEVPPRYLELLKSLHTESKER